MSNARDTEALLKPQSAWLDGGRPAAAGSAATGPWRSGASRGDPSKPTGSRFDTSIGGNRWREEEREAVARRDGGRWGEGAEAGGGGRQFAEPHNPAWTDVPAKGRGREADSWKARERDGGEWRSSSDAAGMGGGGGGSWRSERWAAGGGTPGAPRNDNWRTGAAAAPPPRFGPAEPSLDGSRGFGMGRGRGRGGGGGGLVGGIGAADRAGAGGGSFRPFGGGGGGGVGGRMRWGPSSASRRYPTDELARLYKRMLYSGRLRLPGGVERDDPLLFLSDAEFVDVVEQLAGVDPAVAAQAFADHHNMMRAYSSHRPLPAGGEEGPAAPQRAHSALVADGGEVLAAAVVARGASVPAPPPDEYCYKDPQGVVQGPFARQDIIDWYEAGYFPLELEVRGAQEPPEAPFKPLAALLRAWNKAVGPPGFAAAQPAPQPEPQAAAMPPEPEPAATPFAPEPEPAPTPFAPEPEPAPTPFAPEPEPAAEPAPLALPEAEDLLAASLGGLHLSPAPSAASAAAPWVAPEDPIVDPALIRRSASSHLLQAQAGAAPALGGQPSLPGLPLGGPLAQLQALGSGALAAGASFGLLPQQDAFLGAAPQHLPPAPAPRHLAPQPHLAPQLGQLGGVGVQQASQQELPSWLAAPGPAPAPLQPAPQPAPAPAQAPPPAAPAPQPRASLLDIQREQAQQEAARRQQAEAAARAAEEERRAAAEAAAALLREEVHEAAPPPPPPPRGAGQQVQAPRPETKAAPWAAGGSKKKSAKTLLEIQQEEAERAARLAAEEAAAAAAAPPAPGGGWAKAARGNMSGGSMLSLREIQEQEEAAARAAALAASAAQAQPGAGSFVPPADDDDGGLFWDYGVQGGAAAAPPPPPRPAAAAAPRKPAALPAAKAGGWASAVAATTAAAPLAPPPRAQAAPTSRAAVAAAAPPPAQPAPQQTSALDAADAAAISAALSDGSSALQGPFRAWCAERMLELTGSADVSLPEFLLTVESNSELAEYCTLYLGSTPAVARFAAEFMKRKLAEAAAAAKSSKSRRNKAKAAPAAAAPAAAPAAAARPEAAGPPGYSAPASAFPALGASAAAAPAGKDDWEKVPKTVGKKKKGKKVEPSLLGFSSGTNYDLLDKP